ncbi:MAG: VOC family protein [Bdellovibrionota bacterium]
MKPAFLDHIGIAVKPGSRLAEALGVLGLPITGTELVEREKVHTAWIPLPNQPGHVELLNPSEPASVIQTFLDKQGKDAVHHLSFRVEDIRAISKRLESEGFKLIYPDPRPGAHNCLVNFIHPKTTGGVLLEITEKQI